jgi:acyl-CoA thioesterase
MQTLSEFDSHIALTPTGAGRYAADLDGGWSVGGGLNGGYLLALVASGIRSSLPGKPDPLAVSAYYLSAARPGPATVAVDVRRDGGRVATASADLVQGDQTRIAVLATYGDLDGLGDDVRTTAPELGLPPVEDCPRGTDAPPEVLELAPIMGRFDMRFHPDDIGWVTGRPSGEGRMRAWFRLADGRDPDPISLLMVLDALPPVTFNLGMPGWAPTLELSAHVRAKPAPGWLKVHHETRNLAGGMFEEDCEVWDSTGRLVAQSRQLAMQPRTS